MRPIREPISGRIPEPIREPFGGPKGRSRNRLRGPVFQPSRPGAAPPDALEGCFSSRRQPEEAGEAYRRDHRVHCLARGDQLVGAKWPVLGVADQAIVPCGAALELLERARAAAEGVGISVAELIRQALETSLRVALAHPTTGRVAVAFTGVMPDEQETRQPQQPEQPPEKFKYEFFVYIVESPSPVDLYHGRSEGERLAKMLQLEGIPCVTRTAINRDALQAALTIGFPEAMKAYPNLYPVLHLSAHGNKDGIQLSTGDLVTWSDLRAVLVPIHTAMPLLLCMSACEGFSAQQMAMDFTDDAPHPYLAMVGNWGSPTWSDTAVAYLSFYHLLARGRTLSEAVIGMRAASGNGTWGTDSAQNIRQSFLEFVRSQAQTTPAEVQQQLENAAEQSDLPADAKALENRAA